MKLIDTFTDEDRKKYPNYYRLCENERLLDFARWMVDGVDCPYDIGEWIPEDDYSSRITLVQANTTEDQLVCLYLDLPFSETMRERRDMLTEKLGEITKQNTLTGTARGQ